MNFHNMPELSLEYGYPLALLVITGLADIVLPASSVLDGSDFNQDLKAGYTHNAQTGR